jgi:hypothetical protein
MSILPAHFWAQLAEPLKQEIRTDLARIFQEVL